MSRRAALTLLMLVLAACASAFAGATHTRANVIASAQAQTYFKHMLRAQDSTGVEQAACVAHWMLELRDGVSTMHLLRIRDAEDVTDAHIMGVTFACRESEGTVHTHSSVCVPSETDRVGDEAFGVVLCPQPPWFATFAVRPARRAP